MSRSCSDVKAERHQPGSVSEDEALSMQPTTIIKPAARYMHERQVLVGRKGCFSWCCMSS